MCSMSAGTTFFAWSETVDCKWSTFFSTYLTA
jgi:hypothetical protein